MGVGTVAMDENQPRFCCVITPKQVVNVDAIADDRFVFIRDGQGTLKPPRLLFVNHKSLSIGSASMVVSLARAFTESEGLGRI